MVDVQKIDNYIGEQFARFGSNKRQEMVRLLYEIAKREQKDFREVVKQFPKEANRFSDLKQYLVKRRFPKVTQRNRQVTTKFSKLDINPELKVDLNKKLELTPKHFVIEQSVQSTPLVQRLLKKFPQAQFTYVSAYKDYVKTGRSGIKDYNNRTEQFYIVKESYDFYKKCPCSNKSVSCGYHVINLGSGCAFECSYCYLQDYINTPGIIIPANLEDFFTQLKQYKQDIRLGSGELTDSLIFDHITDFSPLIVDFFKGYPNSAFEFKTKSSNIDNLLTVKPADNIIVSWSINPQTIIETTEHYTASLKERLDAAVRCMNAGYKVAFHFDPMIYYDDWEKDYQALVEQIFSCIDPKRIFWISLGTLRMTPRLKKIIENRFPANTILDEEFLPSYDGKMRYSFNVRTMMYKKMKEWIYRRSQDIHLYLCMEEKDACGVCEAGPLKQYL